MQPASQENSIEIQKPEKPKRPFGVWFLTIWMSLFAGLFPIPLAGFILFFDIVEYPETEISPARFQLLLAILLGVAIIVAAMGTWRGSNKARIAFLVLITIHYILLIYENYQLISTPSPFTSAVANDFSVKSVVRMVRGVFWIVVCWWYFTSKRAKPFYDSDQRFEF